jgi:hypothetical protein
MMLLHLFAAAFLDPAVEFFAKMLVRRLRDHCPLDGARSRCHLARGLGILDGYAGMESERWDW